MQAMNDLTARQAGILRFTEAYVRREGYPPSLRNIMTGCGISSTAVVTYNLQRLERAGYLRVDANVARGIRLPQPEHGERCPTCGQDVS